MNVVNRSYFMEMPDELLEYIIRASNSTAIKQTLACVNKRLNSIAENYKTDDLLETNAHIRFVSICTSSKRNKYKRITKSNIFRVGSYEYSISLLREQPTILEVTLNLESPLNIFTVIIGSIKLESNLGITDTHIIFPRILLTGNKNIKSVVFEVPKEETYFTVVVSFKVLLEGTDFVDYLKTKPLQISGTIIL